MLRSFFDPKSFVTALAFIAGSIPFFLDGQAQLGVGIALGVLATSFADSSPNIQKRLTDFIIASPFFIISSIISLLLWPYPILFAILFPLLAFMLLALGIFGPRMNSIGFASVIFSIYALVINYSSDSGLVVCYHLILGTALYAGMHLIANLFLPNQTEKELMITLYNDIADKIRLHAAPLQKFSIKDKQQFIKTAQERTKLLLLINTLQERLEVQLKSGEISQAQSIMLAKLEVAKLLTRKSRLLNIMPTRAIKVDCAQWLAKVIELNHKVANAVEAAVLLRHDDALGLRAIDFNSVTQYTLPARHQKEAKGILQYVAQLEEIFNCVKSLEQPLPPTFAKEKSHWQTKWRILPAHFNGFSLHSTPIRHASRAALALFLGYGLTELLGLSYGIWALMTSMFVLKPNVSMTWRRLGERLSGTLFGLLLFYLILMTQPSELTLLGLFSISAYGFFYYSTRHYAISVAFITLLIFCAFQFMGYSIELILPRLGNTLLGIAMAGLVVLSIHPGWQKDKFNQQLNHTLLSYHNYLNKLWQQQPSTVLSTALYQSVLHDDTLFNHWQSYLNEPRKAQNTSDTMLFLARRSTSLLRLITAINDEIGSQYQLTSPQKEELFNSMALLMWLKNHLSNQQSDTDSAPNSNEDASMLLDSGPHYLQQSLLSKLQLLNQELLSFKTLCLQRSHGFDPKLVSG